MDPATVARFPPNTVALKLAIALAIGMLVGFERESASKDAGIRTFGLTAMLAAVSIMVSPAFCLVSLAGVIVLVALFNVRSMIANNTLEITTAAALLVTFALGALVGLGHTFTPVAGAILMTILLAWKVELVKFAGGVTIGELRSAVLLGLIGLVIYPILPDRFVDPWQLVNLREAWVTVVVIAGIAFVNYVLLRLYGKRGLLWTAFLGGLVNNRAAIAELMNIVQGTRIVGVVLFATLAMFIRNIFLLAVFAPRALYIAVGPMVAMAVVSFLVPAGRKGDEPGQELTLGSPVSLRRVMSYGILFLGIQVLSTLAERGIRGRRVRHRQLPERDGQQRQRHRRRRQSQRRPEDQPGPGRNSHRLRLHGEPGHQPALDLPEGPPPGPGQGGLVHHPPGHRRRGRADGPALPGVPLNSDRKRFRTPALGSCGRGGGHPPRR